MVVNLHAIIQLTSDGDASSSGFSVKANALYRRGWDPTKNVSSRSIQIQIVNRRVNL